MYMDMMTQIDCYANTRIVGRCLEISNITGIYNISECFSLNE